MFNFTQILNTQITAKEQS